MPSIRQEMRVSQKLAPEIVGPSLKTATEILDSAYSKRTRETQQVLRRNAHDQSTWACASTVRHVDKGSIPCSCDRYSTTRCQFVRNPQRVRMMKF